MIGGRNIDSLRYVDDTTLLLLRVKEESEWAGLKLVSQKLRSWHLAHYCMANRRGKGGSREFLLGSKVTADDDCGHEIRRQLLLGRKAVTSLDSVLKSRDITLPTKVHIVKATVFPVVLLQLWELDCKKGRTPKNWCLWTVTGEDSWKSLEQQGDQP